MRVTRALVVCMSMIFLIVAGTDGFVAAQHNQFNITNIEPNQLYPGTVFAVNGGQYIDDNSEIYIGQSFALQTYFESANKLVAIVPLEPNICGEQGIIVKTTVNLNNNPTPIDSNFVVKVINCPNPNNITPAAPEIDDVTLLDVISGAAIRLRGENFIPSSTSTLFSINNAYPYTEVRVYNDDYEYEGQGDYESFGRMRFDFPDGVYCGTYTVSVQNRIPSSPSSPTATSQVNINENCLGNGNDNGNGQAGGAEVMNLELPSTAYIDERINGSVQVRNTATFYGRYFNEMELYVNGELRDTQELELDLSETQTFPLTFRFDRRGSYEIEVRVGESYQRKTVEVSSQNGTSPPPNGTPPPTQGGSSLADYDMDGDCVLSDTEFFVTTDAWIGESISDLLFFSAVDAWIGQSNICTAASSDLNYELRVTARGLVVSSASGDSLGAVVLYDPHGREVFSQSTSSNRLFWNLRDVMNNPVANGVYFVRIGSMSKLKKVVVMR